MSGDVRAARTAGKNPPRSPMPQAKTSAVTMTLGVGSKEKTISDQLAMLTIEKRTKAIAIEAAAPTAPPTAARMTASRRNDARMLALREAERAQRADLALAVRHGGVHRDRGADHRADGEEDGHDRPERARRRAPRPPTASRRTSVSRRAWRPRRLSFSTPARNASNLLGESRRTRTLETIPCRPYACRRSSRSTHTSDS